MSIYGGWKTATITILTDAKKSNAVDLGGGGGYDFLDVKLPTLDSCTVALHVCETDDGTYVPLGNGVTTATTTGGYATTCKLGGWNHIKVVTSADQTVNRTIIVRGGRY